MSHGRRPPKGGVTVHFIGCGGHEHSVAFPFRIYLTEEPFNYFFTLYYTWLCVCTLMSLFICSSTCIFVINQQPRVRHSSKARPLGSCFQFASGSSPDLNLHVLKKRLSHICQNSSFEQRTILNGFMLRTVFSSHSALGRVFLSFVVYK